MKARRELLIALGVGVLAAPLAAMAQQKPAMARVGILSGRLRQAAIDTGVEAGFLKGMRDL